MPNATTEPEAPRAIPPPRSKPPTTAPTQAPPPAVAPPIPEPGQNPASAFAQERQTTVIELPSGGRFYDGKLPNGRVEAFVLTAREDKILSAIDATNTQRIFDMVLARAVRSPISPAEMLSTDRFFLMLALKANALGPELEWLWKCQFCGKTTPQMTRVPWDFPIIRGEVELEPFVVVIPNPDNPEATLAVALRMLRGSDDRAIEAFRMPKVGRTDASNAELEPGDVAYGYEIGRQIVSVNGKPFASHEAAAEWYLGLPMASGRTIRNACERAAPGISTTATAKCACGKETPGVAVPLPAYTFW